MKAIDPLKGLKPVLDRAAAFLNSRTLREKQLLIGFVLVFLVCVDYFVLIAPFVSVYFQVSPKIGPLKEQYKMLVEDQQNAKGIAGKWTEARQALDAKEEQFISPDETPALLENLSKEALQSGVKITSLEPFDLPKSKKSSSPYTPLPIQVKAAAGTHEFGAFLARLENGKTFFNVTDLRIAVNPLDERKHAISWTMEAFKKDK